MNKDTTDDFNSRFGKGTEVRHSAFAVAKCFPTDTVHNVSATHCPIVMLLIE